VSSPIHTVLIAAVSADGKIANQQGDQSTLTNAADRAHLASYLRAADLLLVGRRTFEEHQAVLQRYRCVVATRNPLALNATAPQAAHAGLWQIPNGPILWTPDLVPLPELCQRLQASSPCIVGGSKLYTTARLEGWVDEMVLTYVPNINLRGGIPLFEDLPDETVWNKLSSGEVGFTLAEETSLPGSTPSSRWQVRHYQRET
jgi:dihydrofolate reductase